MVMNDPGHVRAQHWGPSCCPCHSLYLVMSPPNTLRRKCHWPQGVIPMQQEMGRRQGAAKAEISYPDVSFVCGAGLKQKMIGKASGDPRHQMKEAMDSINGLTASRQSAHWPKQPFSPHPWVQQSGHTVCTASWTIFGPSVMILAPCSSDMLIQVIAIDLQATPITD